jgi:hypothetical protein
VLGGLADYSGEADRKWQRRERLPVNVFGQDGSKQLDRAGGAHEPLRPPYVDELLGY